MGGCRAGARAAAGAGTDGAGCSAADDVPSYVELFPDLPAADGTSTLGGLTADAVRFTSSRITQVLQIAVEEQKKREDNSIRIDMQVFFEAVKEKRGWDRAATEKLIRRGRSLFRLANLRPEEVLGVRMYTVRVLALVHVFSLTLRLYSSLQLGFI